MKNLLLTFLMLSAFFFFANAQEWNSQSPNTLFAENGNNQITPIAVGIGTNSPTANLHVSGPLRFQGLASDPNVTDILGVLNNGNVRRITTDDINMDDWHLTGNTVTASDFIGTLNNEAFRMRTNDLRRMEIEAGGRVNIFENPTSTLPGRNLFNVYTDQAASYNSTTHMDGIHLFNENSTEVSNTGVSLVFGARNSLDNFARAAISGVIPIDANGIETRDIMDIVFQHEVLNTANPNSYIESMRITSDGNVGIGITLPTAQLHTTGSVRFDGLTTNNTSNFLALDANNNVVVTTCSCNNISGGRPMISGDDEIEALKERITLLEEIIEKQLQIQNASTNTSTHTLDGAALYQNAPNPFSSSTTIGFNIPQNAENAKLVINNISGQILKEILIEDRGKGQIELLNNEMASGFYSYSLIINGKIIDSKKMIVTD